MLHSLGIIILSSLINITRRSEHQHRSIPGRTRSQSVNHHITTSEIHTRRVLKILIRSLSYRHIRLITILTIQTLGLGNLVVHLLNRSHRLIRNRVLTTNSNQSINLVKLRFNRSTQQQLTRTIRRHQQHHTISQHARSSSINQMRITSSHQISLSQRLTLISIQTLRSRNRRINTRIPRNTLKRTTLRESNPLSPRSHSRRNPSQRSHQSRRRNPNSHLLTKIHHQNTLHLGSRRRGNYRLILEPCLPLARA
ncbi:Uncharacterised protein [Mobiluncus mulieris]|nr:Uncharacterised protein [Mobiluncus mulieris]